MLEEDATQHPEVGRRVFRLEAAELQAPRATQRSLGRTLTLRRSAAVGLSAASGVLLQFASLPHHRVRADGAIRLRLDLLLNLLPSCCRPRRSGALGHAPSRHREGKSGGSTLAALGTSGSASCHARHREREASGAGRHAGILTRHREATKAEGLLGRGVVVSLRTLAWRTRHGEREASVEAGHRKKERRHRELLRPSGIAGEGRLLGRRCLGLVGAATAATATALGADAMGFLYSLKLPEVCCIVVVRLLHFLANSDQIPHALDVIRMRPVNVLVHLQRLRIRAHTPEARGHH
mmetsp:Transcript_109809/g.354279  ORF Transcript_109809/g.354279 Transcript_109809/m.354279 type:complete len:294 (-) Transcript_109809:2063-2944(-)